MNKLKIVIPKGRLSKNVIAVLNEVGMGIETDDRSYIPRVKTADMGAKIMKPQNIPSLVEFGSHDVGFTGYDWIKETGADVEVLLDLNFNPVSIVAAIPESMDPASLFSRKIAVATEYPELAARYLDERGFEYGLIRTFGATEVFPPDDADMIIDNMSSGRTLEEHNLKVMDRLLFSTTRMLANKNALMDPWKKRKIDELKMLVQSVLDAEDRVMLEMNVPADKLATVVPQLPCMRAPTVARLYGDEGYAVKIAIKKSECITLIPKLKEMGAVDILEYDCKKVMA